MQSFNSNSLWRQEGGFNYAAGVIAAFKNHFKTQQSEEAIRLDEVGVIDQFELSINWAIELTMIAWDHVIPDTVRNCFRKVGFINQREDEFSVDTCSFVLENADV